MRRPLYRYIDKLNLVDSFLDGELWFRPLSYYRAYEDHQVRGDKNEGVAVFCCYPLIPGHGLPVIAGTDELAR